MKNTNQYFVDGDVTRILTYSGKYITIDTEVADTLKPFSWCVTGTGYAMTRSGGPAVLMHRLIAGAGPGEFVDHINGDGLDNRRANLRLCRKQQNEFNTKLRSDNTSGFRGVCKSKSGKFRAYINRDGHQYNLGVFEDPVEAAKTYNTKAQELFGEFARLNPV